MKILKDAISRKRSELTQIYLEEIYDEQRNLAWGMDQPSVRRRDDLLQKFCVPLYKLLLAAASDNRIKQVYLDERLRYAPHREPLPRRTIFHRENIEREADVLIRGMSAKDRPAFIQQWTDFHQQILQVHDQSPVVVLTIGDCLLTEVRVFINGDDSNKSHPIDLRCMYFSAATDGGFDIAQVSDYLKANKVDAIALSFFSFDAMPGFQRYFQSGKYGDFAKQCDQYLGLCEIFLDQLTESYKGQLLIHNVCGLPLSRERKWLPWFAPFSKAQGKILNYLNDGLAEIVLAQGNAILVDESGLIDKHGARNMSRSVASQRRYGGHFHTSELGFHIAIEYRRHLDVYRRFSGLKVLLLDFDNTLWSGVMAEGDVEHYVARQKLLTELKAGGIVLAAVSKNSPENIRWQEMTLQRQDFVSEKISWQPKVNSIRELAQELNLGLNSFVFIDDNHHERAMVENELPEVQCLDATDEQVWSDLELLKSTPMTKTTAEAAARTEMYREQAERRKVMVSGQDKAEMYSKLGLKFKMRINDHGDIDRVLELIERTNQFNTTTRRHSRSRVQQMFADPAWSVFAFTLADDFGDLGVVGVVLLETTGEQATVDSLIMSCRAMGFGLEKQMVFEVTKFASSANVQAINAPFVASDRNSPCAGLFASLGFTEKESGLWSMGESMFDTLSSISWLQKET